MKIGYARVSTREQNLDMQIDALTKAGCEKIFSEKKSGKDDHRVQLRECMNYLRSGDTLVVYNLSRLSRSLKKTLQIIEELHEKEANFSTITENITTEGPAGRLTMAIFGAIAQFQRDAIVEACQDGRQLAKEKGVKFGRPSGKVNDGNLTKIKSCQQLYQSGSTIKEIMQSLSIGSAETVYRYLEKAGIKPNRK
ncbi:MAG: helix-turn-helix protein [Bacteroidetes bacterium]|nr:helix-turn-helix protein [Bacteroidota bacterium]